MVFLRGCYECPRQIFIFDNDQGQINSVTRCGQKFFHECRFHQGHGDGPMPHPSLSTHTANNFGIMYSRKRISQNSFPNFIYIFPSMIFCQELQDPERNCEIQISTQGPKDVIMKKTSQPGFELWNPANVASILSLDHQSRYQRFLLININSIKNYQELVLVGHFYWVQQICSLNWDLYMYSFVGTTCIWLWWSNVKILTIVAGVLGLNPGCEFYYVFKLTRSLSHIHSL